MTRDIEWDRRKEELALLAKRMKASLAEKRRPFVIEFSGTPKAGKSTSVAALSKFFRRNDIPVHVVVERASLCPLKNKNSPLFNVWTAATSLAQMLEGVQKEPSIVILDRGMFDALVWMRLHLGRTALQDDEFATIASFVTLGLWRELISIVVALRVDPLKALEREYKDQLVDEGGSVMNERTIREYNSNLDACLRDYATTFNLLMIDTTATAPREGVIAIAEKVLAIADDVLDEEIAVIDRNAVAQFIPASGVLRDRTRIAELVDTIRKQHKWMRRAAAEATRAVIQPIPAAVFHHGERSILTCEIRGPKHERLENAHAVWIGGHLRRSDAQTGKGIAAMFKKCMARELYEEIQVRVKMTTLPDLPAAVVLDDTHERSVQHLGLLFECRSGNEVNDVYDLHNREFSEAEGKSMFLQVHDVDSSLSSLPNWERWSMLYLSAKYGLTFPPYVRQRYMF